MMMMKKNIIQGKQKEEHLKRSLQHRYAGGEDHLSFHFRKSVILYSIPGLQYCLIAISSN